MNSLLSSTITAELCKWCIIVGIAWTLAMGVLAVLEGPTTNTTAATPPWPTGGTVERFNVNSILNKHLFGSARTAPQGAAPQQPETDTKLPLDLFGVFVAERPQDSAAIVAQRGRAGELRLIGEKLPGNATLTEVYADRVILERLGKREVLRFDDEETGIIAQGDRTPALTPAGRERFAGARLRDPTGAIPGEVRSDQEPAVVSTGQPVAGPTPRSPREFLQAYSDQLEKDPEGLLARLDVKPVSAAGSEGYRLGNLASSPQLGQFGLQSGDVILSVNGQPVGNVQQDRGRLGGLMAQGSARLEIQRGSRRFYVTASLK